MHAHGYPKVRAFQQELNVVEIILVIAK